MNLRDDAVQNLRIVPSAPNLMHRTLENHTSAVNGFGFGIAASKTLKSRVVAPKEKRAKGSALRSSSLVV